MPTAEMTCCAHECPRSARLLRHFGESACGSRASLLHYKRLLRIWWNWQTRYFEVVVGQPVQVQVLLCAPNFLGFLYLSFRLILLRFLRFSFSCSGLISLN